jgi:isopentenyl diphosphate isomerase/L-lactate dehydrogenase-like FMN-dependent dehydrogenase
MWYRERRIERVLNVAEMRALARRRLPGAVFDVIDGGAADEITVRANCSAFEDVWLRPRALADVSTRSVATTVLGETISMPLMLAPCGFSRLCDSDAELASVRAAGHAGTGFVLSGAATAELEDAIAVATAPLWYQLYMSVDQQQNEALLDRVERAGLRVLCVTIDGPVSPIRDRDYRNRLTFPLRLTPRLLATGLSRPGWSWRFMFGQVGGGPGGIMAGRQAYWRFAQTVSTFRSVTQAEVRWLRERWKGPLVVKGIMRSDEVAELVELGVDGLVVSNHGGRNLDCVRPSIAVLPEVLEAVDGRVEVYLDGGVRRGTDVVKALALGARACLIGRPYMFGLAAGGEAGVARVLAIFATEIENAMGMAGCATVADIDAGVAQNGVWRRTRSAQAARTA